MKKLILFIGLLFCVTAARAATCDAGYYLENGECILCPAYHYCPGDDSAVACPDAVEHMRTTFPEEYFNPEIEDTFVHNERGTQSINYCMVLTFMLSERGGLYEYVYYNPETEKYDVPIAEDWSWGWGTYWVSAGYYFTTPTMCGSMAYYRYAKECPAGYYCPGKEAVECNSSNQAIVHTETFGLEMCPAGSYCPAGAAAPTPCPVGTYSDTTGASDESVCKPCTNAPQNARYTNDATTNSCPWECDAGYGLHNGACVLLCAAGMQHIKTGNGLSFNLYQAAYSTPALHVKHNDTVCYGVLAPGAAKDAININHNGQVYHTVD